MSLHIVLFKYEKRKIREHSINIAQDFLNKFSDVLEPKQIRFLVEHVDFAEKGYVAQVLDEVTSKSLIREKGLLEPFGKFVGKLDPALESHTEIEIRFKVGDNLGFLKVNNLYNGKIYGNIEVDIFPRKDIAESPRNFLSLLHNGTISPEKLDKFFSAINSNSRNLIINRALVDLDEEGSNNPLDVYYLFDFDGRSLFRRTMHVLELLADEDSEIEKIYTNSEGIEKNYLASLLWEKEGFQSFVFGTAEKCGMVAAGGSIRLYARNQEELKKFYGTVIKNIFKDLFIDHEPVQERVERVATLSKYHSKK